jgi:hypothetical protein
VLADVVAIGPPPDPVRAGRSECEAWVGYHRRDRLGVLRGVLGLVRNGTGLGPVDGVRAAWHVLRAHQAWAPYPDDDPAAAVRRMERFYRLLAHRRGLAIDPRRAALLEVDWWREHRLVQHVADPPAGGRRIVADDRPLVAAMTRLYAYVHDVPEDRVRTAAALRVGAMHLGDAWVARGCRDDDPALRDQRRLLVVSYAELQRATGR